MTPLPTGKSINAMGGPPGSGLIYLLVLSPAATPPYSLRWDTQFCSVVSKHIMLFHGSLPLLLPSPLPEMPFLHLAP